MLQNGNPKSRLDPGRVGFDKILRCGMFTRKRSSGCNWSHTHASRWLLCRTQSGYLINKLYISQRSVAVGWPSMTGTIQRHNVVLQQFSHHPGLETSVFNPHDDTFMTLGRGLESMGMPDML